MTKRSVEASGEHGPGEENLPLRVGDAEAFAALPSEVRRAFAESL